MAAQPLRLRPVSSGSLPSPLVLPASYPSSSDNTVDYTLAAFSAVCSPRAYHQVVVLVVYVTVSAASAAAATRRPSTAAATDAATTFVIVVIVVIFS